MNYIIKLLSASVYLMVFTSLYPMKRSYEQSLEQPTKKLAFQKSVTYRQAPLYHAQINLCNNNNNQVPPLEFRLSDAVCEACKIGFNTKEKAWDHLIHMHLKCPWCTIPSFGKISIKYNRVNFIMHVQRQHAEKGIFICGRCSFITTIRSGRHACILLNSDQDRADHCNDNDDILLCCKYCRNFEAQDADIFREHEEICSYLQDFLHEE